MSFEFCNLTLNNMLLAIDIGNTNISFAIFNGGKIIKNWDIPLKEYRGIRTLETPIKDALICSVVPQITQRVSRDIKKTTGVKPKIIGKDILIPLKNLYKKPEQLGMDRLVNAYAASQIYSAPVIIVSCGTAITVDAVSKISGYLGGFIIPGLNSSLSALNLNTALLPKVKLAPTKKNIGKNTQDCILNGVVLGSASAIDALIETLRIKIGKNTKIIGTGGDINLIKRFSKCAIRVNKNLLLNGIFLLYKGAFLGKIRNYPDTLLKKT